MNWCDFGKSAGHFRAWERCWPHSVYPGVFSSRRPSRKRLAKMKIRGRWLILRSRLQTPCFLKVYTRT